MKISKFEAYFYTTYIWIFGFVAFLIKVTVSGEENIFEQASFILMGNHVSFLDALLLAALTPYHTIGIEDKSHFSWPFFGTLIQ